MISLTFTVPGKSISVNKRYRGHYHSTPEYTEWKARVREQAWLAKIAEPVWPPLESIKRHTVEVEIVAFGSRHDCDGPCKAAMDALEGVFYVRDSAVKRVVGDTEDIPKGTEPYIRITVTLLES